MKGPSKPSKLPSLKANVISKRKEKSKENETKQTLFTRSQHSLQTKKEKATRERFWELKTKKKR